MLLGSGSIRKEKLGPIVVLQDLMEIFPYDDAIHMVNVTGKQLKSMILYMLRDEAFEGDHTEFYQFSSGLSVDYSRKNHKFNSFTFEGQEVDDDRLFKVGLQNYHYINIESGFGISLDEINKNGKPRMVASSCRDILEEYLSENQHLDSSGSGRIIIK